MLGSVADLHCSFLTHNNAPHPLITFYILCITLPQNGVVRCWYKHTVWLVFLTLCGYVTQFGNDSQYNVNKYKHVKTNKGQTMWISDSKGRWNVSLWRLFTAVECIKCSVILHLGINVAEPDIKSGLWPHPLRSQPTLTTKGPDQRKLPFLCSLTTPSPSDSFI